MVKKMIYSDKLKTLRENLELSQTDMANIIKVDRSAYGQYEREYVIIPINHLITLCDYFKVSVDYIFNLSHKNNNNFDETSKEISGKRIKNWRKEKKLTQEKIAQLLNTNRSVIANYERGRNYIATPFLYDLCNYYNVSVDYVFGLTLQKNYLDSKKDVEKEIVGQRLKSFRKENKLTQYKLAKVLNTTFSTISGYEKGRFLILTSFLYTICKKYKVSADYLLGKSDKPKYLND